MRLPTLLSVCLAVSEASILHTASRPQDPNGVLEKRQSPYPVYTIDQPIDHFPKSPRYAPHTNATFKQRYIFDSQFYKDGGPVFLYLAGEVSIESRLSNIETGIIRLLMEAFNGIGIILEGRYYGQSFPFNTSTTDELAYMTVEQTVADNAFFAQNAKFPGVKSSASLTAPTAPWILYGGSLAGSHTAFTMKEHGLSGTGVLWGGIASSSCIHPYVEYPQWYHPIQKYAPGDCTAPINAIVDKMDYLVKTKNERAIQELKEIFGLGALKDIRDFAMTIAFPIGGPLNYPTNTWQEIVWEPKGSQDFWDFCASVADLDAPPHVTAVDYQMAKYTNGEPWQRLGNYAEYLKRVVLQPNCPNGDVNNVLCFGTQNETFYADATNSDNRSYLYSTCTEQGAYQVAPSTGPSLISRVLQRDYTQQWCTWAFPKGKFNSIPAEPNLNWYKRYGSFDFVAKRLAFIDGEQDVWRDVGYHSAQAPSPRYSTLDGLHPEHLISGGGHHVDSSALGSLANMVNEPSWIRVAHKWELRVVETWLRQWRTKEGVRRREL